MKYALVTGGSRGIGRAICLKLAEMNYHVLINYQANEHEALITLQQIIGYRELILEIQRDALLWAFPLGARDIQGWDMMVHIIKQISGNTTQVSSRTISTLTAYVIFSGVRHLLVRFPCGS